MKRFKLKQTALLSRAELDTFRGRLLYWLFFGILCLMVAVCVIPMAWTIASALKDSQEIYTNPGFIPQGLTLKKAIDRIIEAWDALDFGKSIVNTIVLSVGNVFFKVMMCGFGGYALSKMRPKGGTLIFALVLWGMMMPSQIRMVPNYISYQHFPFALDFGVGVSLMDTFWPFWLAQGADCFAIMLFKNTFDGLSNSYIEAAKLDGASNIQIILQIIFPLSIPLIVYVSIGAMNSAWNDFLMPRLVLNKIVTLPVAVFNMSSTNNGLYMNTYFMGLIIASVPTFLIFAIFQRQIMGGINVGGVKG